MHVSVDVCWGVCVWMWCLWARVDVWVWICVYGRILSIWKDTRDERSFPVMWKSVMGMHAQSKILSARYVKELFLIFGSKYRPLVFLSQHENVPERRQKATAICRGPVQTVAGSQAVVSQAKITPDTWFWKQTAPTAPSTADRRFGCMNDESQNK